MKYQSDLPAAPRTLTRPGRSRRVVVTVPTELNCPYSPGDRISTPSGEAVVTAIEQVGRSKVIHAKHGAGLPQPYRVEDVLWVGTKVQATLNLFGKLQLLNGVVVPPLADIPGVAFVNFQAGDRTLQVQLPKDRLFPLAAPLEFSPIEQVEARAEDAIANIEQEICRMKAAGSVAPQSCWIERSRCYKRSGKSQAFYRTNDPGVFNGKKVKYIGMVGSAKEKAATEAVARRNDLVRLRRQLAILQGS